MKLKSFLRNTGSRLIQCIMDTIYTFYYNQWFHSQNHEPSFYLLDIGKGKEVSFDKFPRSKQQQCIKYLSPLSLYFFFHQILFQFMSKILLKQLCIVQMKRKPYEVIVVDEKFDQLHI